MRALRRPLATVGSLIAIGLLVVPGPLRSQEAEPEPRVIAASEGHVEVSLAGVQARFKVGSISTGAARLTIATSVFPPGHETVTHLHQIDEEVVYVLQGELTVTLAGQEYTAGPGATVFIPPGTWMSIANRTETSAFVLGVLSRGELEECFRVLFSTDADEAARREAVDLCRLEFPATPLEESG